MRAGSIIIGIAVAITACSCLGTKKVTETNSKTVQTESLSHISDKQETTAVNRAINENTGISLKTGDSLVDARIRQALRNFNFQKSSGTNSTSVRFDDATMSLLLANIIGETADKSVKEVDRKETERSFEQETDSYIFKKMSQIPWWVYVIAGLYFLPKIIDVAKIIFIPFAGMIAKISKK